LLLELRARYSRRWRRSPITDGLLVEITLSRDQRRRLPVPVPGRLGARSVRRARSRRRSRRAGPRVRETIDRCRCLGGQRVATSDRPGPERRRRSHRDGDRTPANAFSASVEPHTHGRGRRRHQSRLPPQRHGGMRRDRGEQRPLPTSTPHGATGFSRARAHRRAKRRPRSSLEDGSAPRQRLTFLELPGTLWPSSCLTGHTRLMRQRETRTMRRLIAVSMLCVLWITEATAAGPVAITETDQKDVMVTIYNGNLGLVKDTREVRLDDGTLEVKFMDVAAQIDPTSVHLKSLTEPGGLKILEQNYEYDLLTSDKLMEKYVGKKVRLYQSNGSYQEAVLLSTNGPVWQIDGQIHMGHSGYAVLPAMPDNLVSKPTLVWLLRNARQAP